LDPKAEQLDNILLTFAQQCGGIQEILHNFCAFLARRTDFYYIQDENNKNTGFPEGVAEKMLLETFRHYQKLADAKFQEMKQQPPKVIKPEKKKKKKKKPLEIESSADEATPSSSASLTSVSEAAQTSGVIEPLPAVAPSQTSSEGPGTAKQSASTYNGAETENYSWSQTLYEATVEVPMPKGTKGKDLDVVISKEHLKIGLKGKPPVIDGKLPEAVDCEDSMYVINSGVVQVTLVKKREIWWKYVVEGEPEIDTQKVDSTRSISEYDEETQAGIHKIMFDQEQKRKGLPTSDQIKNEDLLKKAWNAEGSPFQGQPYDPSVLNMQGDGMGGVGGMPEMPGMPDS